MPTNTPHLQTVNKAWLCKDADPRDHEADVAKETSFKPDSPSLIFAHTNEKQEENTLG